MTMNTFRFSRLFAALPLAALAFAGYNCQPEPTFNPLSEAVNNTRPVALIQPDAHTVAGGFYVFGRKQDDA